MEVDDYSPGGGSEDDHIGEHTGTTDTACPPETAPGAAFGAPGISPTWSSSDKDFVTTALGGSLTITHLGDDYRLTLVLPAPQRTDRPLHGQPSPHDRLHPRLYLAEAVGTAVLVFAGLSLVIGFAWILPATAWRRALTGACFGLVGASIAISPLGRVSGAHINPAVTLAFYLVRKLAWRDALGYVLAQMIGAVIGAAPLLLWGNAGRNVQYGATTVGKGVGLWQAFAGEFVATLALILVIFISASHERTRRFTPWTIPPLFAWLVWWEGPLSGASTNPARSFGPAIISHVWSDFWIYLVAPLAGAALAVALLQINLLGKHRVSVARVAHHD